MNAQLDSLQLKIQTQILQATFLKNMAFLKQYMPAIYQFYQSYTPQKIHLAVDPNGAINLSSNNQFVYQDDPKEASAKQVEKFLKKPPCFKFEISRTNNKTYQYQHQKVLNEILNKRVEELSDFSPYVLKPGGQINYIAFMGSGLGHHIEALLSQYSIRSLFIYEPEPDVFFATLHCVDIVQWFEHCHHLGGELTFKIGGIEAEFVNDIALYFKREGSFNLVQMYLYRHYVSDKTTDAFKMLNEIAYRYRSGWGFCEDEIIGISHTLSNISENKASILLNKIKKTNHKHPVFIIGNGPSLSEHFEYIKQNQKNAIIISSGTSLKPLLDNGIKPDIHVEQERPKSIYHWVKKIGHEETLKQIPLICLNTVYPGILDLFKKPYVAMKYGDAGTAFIHEYISDKYAELMFCNPTVTNASTSSAISMGFNNLYLFGLDYGFKSKESQHAKGSIYDGIEGYQLQSELVVAGNFGGTIETTSTFDYSRGVLEMLLEKNKDVSCINVSDGAKIGFTTPCKVEDLPIFNVLNNKEKFLDDTLQHCFTNDYVISHHILTEFEAVFPTFKKYVSFLCECLNRAKTKNELTSVFSIQYQFVNEASPERDRKLFKHFFIGSLNYLQATIMDNVVRYEDELAQQTYIQFCINEMQQHLLFLLDDLSEHFNKDARV